MISFKNVSFSYEKDELVLNSMDLNLSPGLSLLLGPNGCGKSTLLKLAAGVEKPDSGHISIEGHDLWKDEVESRRRLAYLPEHPDLTPYASLKEILNLVCRLRGEPLKKGREAFEFFDLQNHAHRTVRELSLGQRRRAIFATCFVGRPKYILLDEPLEGMDRNIQTEILTWIRRHVKNGAAVVVVSHFIEPFIDLASRAVTIRKGKAVVFKELSEASDKRLELLERLSRGMIEESLN